MNIDFLPALTGAVYTEDTENGIRLHRLTKAEEQTLIDEKNPDYVLRAKSAAGMTIDFTTDAASLDFDFLGERASSKPYAAIDVYTDGVMTHHFGVESDNTASFHVHADLSEGTKRVTVWLPCLFSASIGNFTLPDGASFTPYRAAKRILFLGDSITQGYVTQHPSLTYTAILSRFFDAETLNQAIAGDLFNESHLDAGLAYKPDVITVAYGTNDWTCGADFASSSKAYFDKLTAIYPTVPVFYIPPIWRTDAEKTTCCTFAEMRKTLIGVASSYKNVRVIDSEYLVPHDSAFFFDHVHPNTIGFAQYAFNLTEQIRKEQVL